MKIVRTWSMPNKWTFKIKPIQDLLSRHDVGFGWIDPFAGRFSPAQFKNDIDQLNRFVEFNMDAYDFLMLKEWRIDGAVFDPPYSMEQVSRSYRGAGIKNYQTKYNNRTGSFPKVKDRIADLLPKYGKCISFGWNTCGLGKNRGFEIVELLIVCHGGNRNDTLVTVERKL